MNDKALGTCEDITVTLLGAGDLDIGTQYIEIESNKWYLSLQLPEKIQVISETLALFSSGADCGNLHLGIFAGAEVFIAFVGPGPTRPALKIIHPENDSFIFKLSDDFPAKLLRAMQDAISLQ